VTSGNVDIEAEVEKAAEYWAGQQERSSSDVELALEALERRLAA